MKKRHFLTLRRTAALCSALLLLTALPGCGRKDGAHVRNSFAFDTVVSITFYDNKDSGAVSNAMDRLEYYEKIFSRTNPESELYQVNERLAEAKAEGKAPVTVPVSQELYQALRLALGEAELTGGAFDPTMGRLLELYDFGGEEHTVPTEAERAEILSHCGFEKLRAETREERQAREPSAGPIYPFQLTVEDPDIVIDLGGMAKGYIADQLKYELVSAGVTSAIINLGGNLMMVGSKPDGKPFKIGVMKPEAGSNENLTSFEISSASAVTSGSYQRFFEQGGVTYHHILDPKTGLPAESGLKSVTVVCENSAIADILSTALFVVGESEGRKLLEKFTGFGYYSYHAYFVDENFTVSKY